jgi:hypothetical protein
MHRSYLGPAVYAWKLRDASLKNRFAYSVLGCLTFKMLTFDEYILVYLFGL